MESSRKKFEISQFWIRKLIFLNKWYWKKCFWLKNWEPDFLFLLSFFRVRLALKIVANNSSSFRDFNVSSMFFLVKKRKEKKIDPIAIDLRIVARSMPEKRFQRWSNREGTRKRLIRPCRPRTTRSEKRKDFVHLSRPVSRFLFSSSFFILASSSLILSEICLCIHVHNVFCGMYPNGIVYVYRSI